MSRDLRAEIIDEALTWAGTPYHHAARSKGVGVDCANLLVGVFSAVGLVPDIDLGAYPIDWHLHKDDQLFVSRLLDYADRLDIGDVPKPGDIAMFRYGRHPAHGAIVTAWPFVIHAWAQVGRVVLTSVSTGPLSSRMAGCYRVRGVD